MIDRVEIHLGYEVGVSIVHQGTNPRIGSLFISSYITQLIRGMHILEGTNQMKVVGGVTFITLTTLRSIGMLQCMHIARGVKYCVR